MKTGRTVVELARELQSIRERSKDYVVPTSALSMNDVGKVVFKNGSVKEFDLTDWSHQQMSAYTDIPKPYYDRLMAESPTLLSRNVNHGLVMKTQVERKRGSESRMLRTIDNRVRALLSSRYRRLDCYDLVDEVFPLIAEHKLEVVSSELTERRMFLKALSPNLKSEVKPGDIVQYGIVISSSDVGAGSVRVEPLIYRLICMNGMISQTAIRKFHVGKNLGSDDIQELLTDETKELEDKAFWAIVKDVIASSLKPDVFEGEVDRLRVAAGEPIKNPDIPRVVELSMKATGINGERNKNNIVAALARGTDGAGLTKWGLINAFSESANSEEVGYEESIDLERAAGQILTLAKSDWQLIAAA